MEMEESREKNTCTLPSEAAEVCVCEGAESPRRSSGYPLALNSGRGPPFCLALLVLKSTQMCSL